MGFETAYEAMIEEPDTGRRWAFGMNFTDRSQEWRRLAPACGERLATWLAYRWMLGDDARIMSHPPAGVALRRALELEEETALAKIALDTCCEAGLALN